MPYIKARKQADGTQRYTAIVLIGHSSNIASIRGKARRARLLDILRETSKVS
jgi:hypothetical protein